MGIKRIKIQHFKSIERVDLDIQNLQIFIGENSAGKSNILEAIYYFYENLCFKRMRTDIFNENNTFMNRIDIEIEFDLSQILWKIRHNSKGKEGKYSNYYSKIKGMVYEKSSLKVKMHQIKDGKITWNIDFSDRKVISELFPLYYVDTRKINLDSWNEIWNTIGDLSKIDNNIRDKVHSHIKEDLQNEEYGLKTRYEWIENLCKDMNIKVKPYTSKQYAATLSQIYFEGKEFLSMERKLDMQSNGMNTFNYLCLLISVMDHISKVKLKEPVVLIDEPEISLHNQIIDELIKKVSRCSDNITFLFSTHSTRMVKDVLKLDGYGKGIYHVYKHNKNTKVSRFRLFYETNERRETYCITDDHVNAYFADFLLFVEGETELEVFQNEFLCFLFPELEYVDIIKALSNEVIHRIVSPEKRNYHVPYISLLDRDKIYTFDYKKRKVNIKKEYFNRNQEKEKYYFGRQRKDIYQKRKRIESMEEKCRFSMQNRLLCSCIDEYYKTFKQYIDEYFIQYNTIIADTTIEGMIINPSTLDIVIEFYQKEYPQKKEDLNYLLNGVSNRNRTTDLNIMRMVFGGENDFLINVSNMKKIWENEEEYLLKKSLLLNEEPQKWIERWNKCSISKTKWVSKYLSFYFRKVTELKTEQEVRHFFWNAGKERIYSYEVIFQLHYEEMYKVLKYVCNMYKKEVLLKGK